MKLLGLIPVCVLLVGSAAVAAPTRVFPGARWEEAIPESQGVDAKKFEAATRLLAATVGSNGVQELVIIRHSRMIWKGDSIDRRHGVWSATKSFTSTVLGLLIEDGKCTLDTRVADVLPELKTHYPQATLRDFGEALNVTGEPQVVAPPYPPSPIIAGMDWAPGTTIARAARDGDNWPLTWAEDDALYTTWGDGTGFEPKVEKKLSLDSPGNHHTEPQ